MYPWVSWLSYYDVYDYHVTMYSLSVEIGLVSNCGAASFIMRPIRAFWIKKACLRFSSSKKKALLSTYRKLIIVRLSREKKSSHFLKKIFAIFFLECKIV